MTHSHWNAFFSRGGLTLKLDRGPLPSKDVPVSTSPTKVLDILRVMRKFYATKLSATDSKALGAGSATYADGLGDHRMFEGISKVNMFDPFYAYYKVKWGS
jgi:hypothetical protein